MSGEFNKLTELCLNGDFFENFRTFKEEVDIYFTASETYKKPQNVQVAQLLNLMGDEGRRVFSGLKYKGKNTVPDILDFLEAAIVPKHNVVMAHFKFFTRAQHLGETFDHWLRELKFLLSGCDFGDVENKLLRTQIVLGINNTELQEKLLRADADLTKTIYLIHAYEAGTPHRRKLLVASSEGDELLPAVAEVTSSIRNESAELQQAWERNPSSNGSRMRTIFNCHYCGSSHEINRCPAFGISGGFDYLNEAASLMASRRSIVPIRDP